MAWFEFVLSSFKMTKIMSVINECLFSIYVVCPRQIHLSCHTVDNWLS